MKNKLIAFVVLLGLVGGLTAAKKRAKAAAPAGAGMKGPGLYARFETSKGSFVAQLLEKEAPETVANFAGLASGHKEYTDAKDGEAKHGNFYDGLTFHRVVSDYIIQGGDPKGDSTGGPGWEFEDEVNGLKFDRPGRLAMANSGPDTNGSQFFVTVVPVEALNDKQEGEKVTNHYTIFGQVVEGQKTVDAISKVAAVEEKPSEAVTIKKVEIVRVGKNGKAMPYTPPAPTKMARSEEKPAEVSSDTAKTEAPKAKKAKGKKKGKKKAKK